MYRGRLDLPILPPQRLDEIVATIRSGGVASIPTDTVYGLAALATNQAAVEALAELKGRDSDQPIAVLFDRIEDIAPYLHDPTVLGRVVQHWPGALTAVVQARAAAGFVAPVVTEARTIGIRQPDDELARTVLECWRFPARTGMAVHLRSMQQRSPQSLVRSWRCSTAKRGTGAYRRQWWT
jgi:tRNA threonylcarbamoyl adenosine modification protein (Sua5/YciO/YrdC/YwlC family)